MMVYYTVTDLKTGAEMGRFMTLSAADAAAQRTLVSRGITDFIRSGRADSVEYKTLDGTPILRPCVLVPRRREKAPKPERMKIIGRPSKHGWVSVRGGDAGLDMAATKAKCGKLTLGAYYIVYVAHTYAPLKVQLLPSVAVEADWLLSHMIAGKRAKPSLDYNVLARRIASACVELPLSAETAALYLVKVVQTNATLDLMVVSRRHAGNVEVVPMRFGGLENARAQATLAESIAAATKRNAKNNTGRIK